MASSTTWLVANWKMHGTAQGAAQYAFEVNKHVSTAPGSLRMVFCPPFPFIPHAKLGLPANARLELGAQDAHAQTEGAFTGGVSAPMLKDVGCDYVILGHSERRAAGETCADISQKATTAIAAGLVPILCVGESEADYAAKNTAMVVGAQLKHFAGLPARSYLIAYEPIWAIGSGKTPSGKEIEAAHALVKSALGSALGVLYGGSVKSTNLREILGLTGVDGVLIGGASRETREMCQLIDLASGM